MISDHEVAIRLFFHGYLAHKHFMYINYMKNAKLWAAFLLPPEHEQDLKLLDHCPAISAPDICMTCLNTYGPFGQTMSGRLREGCPICKKIYSEQTIGGYEIQEFTKFLHICHRWCEALLALEFLWLKTWRSQQTTS